MHISEESSKVNGGTENMMASRVRWDRFVISVFALVSTRSCQALDVVSPPYSSHTLFIVPHAFHIIYRWRGTIWFEWWGESERENMMEQRCAQVMTSSQERRITRRIMLQAVYTAVQAFNQTIWECDLHWCGLNCLLHLWFLQNRNLNDSACWLNRVSLLNRRYNQPYSQRRLWTLSI